MVEFWWEPSCGLQTANFSLFPLRVESRERKQISCNPSKGTNPIRGVSTLLSSSNLNYHPGTPLPNAITWKGEWVSTLEFWGESNIHNTGQYSSPPTPPALGNHCLLFVHWFDCSGCFIQMNSYTVWSFVRFTRVVVHPWHTSFLFMAK